MTFKFRINHRLRLLFHVLGLGCLGGAIILQTFVFTSIAQQGYFTAVEQNPVILGFEVILTAFTIIYFIYIYRRLMRTLR
jgi:hypothetical protein